MTSSRPSSRRSGERRRHPTHSLPASGSISKLRFLGGGVAILAALTILAGIVDKSLNKSLPPAHAQPAPSPNSVTFTQAPPAFPTDDRGFVNSAARCDATETALAFGRTQRSLVAICADQNGRYEYRGVRIGDAALLKVPAETTGDGGFLARNEGVTYAVSSTRLLVTSGDTVINREPMIDYRQPHPFAAETGAAPRNTSTQTAPAQSK